MANDAGPLRGAIWHGLALLAASYLGVFVIGFLLGAAV